MSNEKLRLLGHFLIAFTDGQINSLPIDNPLPIEDRLAAGILTACTPIVEEIPEEYWNCIRQNILPCSKPQPKAPRSRKLKNAASSQVSREPKEVSQSSGASVSKASLPAPISNTEALSAGPVSSSVGPKAISAQISAAAKDTSEEMEEHRCSSDDLELWTKSPKKFFSPKGIDIETVQVFSYLSAIRESEVLNRFRWRFVLRQLYISKEAWGPLPPYLFRQKVGLDSDGVSPTSYYDWLKEGRIYFLLSLEKGVGVLFSKLKPRHEITRLALPKAQKRSCADSNTKAVSQYKDDANKCIKNFTASEVKILGDRYENAAKNIATFLEELHKKAGILNGPTSKRSRHTLDSATENDPLYDASEGLRRNSAPEAIGGGNGGPELQEAYVYDSAAEPKHQACMPGSPGCDIHPHGRHDQENATQSSIGSFTISNNADDPVTAFDMLHMVEFGLISDPTWESCWNLGTSMFCSPELEA
ncbi:uncharacterized protein FTOL_08651 [Fusarium torulosum]|uniref:Uncharacterized protein n=1 Tax=Fusarium torulosum TaxID=33205 RepID=A0AAE8SK58_9HYPO|nr:uncharacterized protein FTOL_08651 [Fusarium torulosum]